jgi:hypothetical protein
MKTYQLIWTLFKANRSLRNKIDVKKLVKITQQAYIEDFDVPPDLRAKWEYIINYVPKTSITAALAPTLAEEYPNVLTPDTLTEFQAAFKVNDFEKL